MTIDLQTIAFAILLGVNFYLLHVLRRASRVVSGAAQYTLFTRQALDIFIEMLQDKNLTEDGRRTITAWCDEVYGYTKSIVEQEKGKVQA